MSTSPVSSSLLSVLTQPGSPLSSFASGPLAGVLENAAPQDVVSLSNAALQLQQISGLFGDQLGGLSDGSLSPTQPTDPITALEQTLLQALNPGQSQQTAAPTFNVYG
jgi:hypothetical protein